MNDKYPQFLFLRPNPRFETAMESPPTADDKSRLEGNDERKAIVIFTDIVFKKRKPINSRRFGRENAALRGEPEFSLSVAFGNLSVAFRYNRLLYIHILLADRFFLMVYKMTRVIEKDMRRVTLTRVKSHHFLKSPIT